MPRNFSPDSDFAEGGPPSSGRDGDILAGGAFTRIVEEPSSATAPRMQCRFCLEEAAEEELVAPCHCEGTGRFVHAECLRHWQREVANDERASICQVCKTEFSLRPAPVLHGPMRSRRSHSPGPVSPVFFSVHTNPRYDRDAARSLPSPLRDRLLQCMGPGCLVLQTPSRAMSDSPQLLHQRRGQSSDSVMVMFEAVMLARMAHWHRSVFLLGAHWPGQAVDGTDALIGVNLVGAPVALQELQDVPILQAKLRGIQLAGVIGGPVRQDRTLALVSFKGVPLEPLPQQVRLVKPSQEYRPTASRSSESAAAGGEEDQAEAAEGEPCCSGALFGEVLSVSEVLGAQAQLRPVSALAFQGHAVWSSAQLLSEVARGSWGLTQAFASDLMDDAVRPTDSSSSRTAEGGAAAAPGSAPVESRRSFSDRRLSGVARWDHLWATRDIAVATGHRGSRCQTSGREPTLGRSEASGSRGALASGPSHPSPGHGCMGGCAVS
jgi:putative AlgH/UPF0301 family transcriptional regulator